MRRLILTTALCLPAASLAQLAPSTAEACGGTFCDNGPQSMPVDQTGENVLFHIGDGFVEAHIQIQYDPDTDAEEFAWVIPVTAIPDFSVGSQSLFDNLLASSVPTYGYNSQTDQCGDTGNQSTGTGGSDGDEGGDGDGDGDGGGGPSVVFEDTVGAYDIVVLEGGNIEEVMQWLGDNGYQQDPNAEPILGEYLEDGFLFAALKLTTGTDVDEIHPITIKYDGQEPCVPIKLTRIAAQDDMDVRVFFLQDDRVVPANYRHVLVNPLMIDWIGLASNYKDVISLAVDADSADGNAFVTEYAGTSGNVPTANLWSANWNEVAIEELADTPIGLYEVLEGQGLVEADEWGDEGLFWNHPMLLPLVHQYVPVPDGIGENDFYACLECYEAMIDLGAWDAAAMAADVRERIIDPGAGALALVTENDYLTRMYTTISPNEMTVDPIFREHPDLPEVSNLQIATRQTHCDGSATMTLPDGREVFMPDPNVWPQFQEEMPWEEDIELAAETGPLMNLVDQTEVIDALLAEWNEQNGGADGGGADGGDGDGTGAAGCGCNVESGSSIFGSLALLALFGIRRRRR